MKQRTNITKAFIGKLPMQKQVALDGRLSWRNEKILKHQEDQTEKSIRLDEFRVFYKRPYEFLHTYKELFEKGIYKFSVATKKPLIIDCGANIGLSVLYFKSLYPNAEIIAFEPDESNFHLLQKNVTINHLSTCTLHQAAVWINNDVLSFAAAGSEASRITEQATERTTNVQAIRLADILDRYDKVDFLKIDIEGAEAAVLADVADRLKRVENLFLEYHGKTAETKKLSNILNILEQGGFAAYIQNAADSLAHPFITKKTGGLYDVQLNIFCYRKIENTAK